MQFFPSVCFLHYWVRRAPPVKFLNILLLNEDEIWGSYGSEFISCALTCCDAVTYWWTTVNMFVVFIWDVTVYSLIGGYWHFKGMYCLQSTGLNFSPLWNLGDRLHYSDTFITTYKTMWCHNSDDHIWHNLKKT